MEKLIKIAVKAMEENLGFNEIELSDGVSKVRLVRFTPAPWVSHPNPYQSTYQTPPYYP